MGEAVQAGQLLLISLKFNGQAEYLQELQESQRGETATFLIEQLSAYNSGELCR